MIAHPEDYFRDGCGRCDRFATPGCSTRRWAGALADLRRICLSEGLAETAKWGHPCYMHAGRNVAILGAFRGDVRLTLFDAALISDPAGLLERQGPNSRHADALRFAANDGPAAMEPAIRAFLRQGKAIAEAGLRPPRDAADPDPPDELSEALAADPDLAAAFAALTPGRRKSHVLHLTATANPDTRRARIARLRPKILAGKGATER